MDTPPSLGPPGETWSDCGTLVQPRAFIWSQTHRRTGDSIFEFGGGRCADQSVDWQGLAEGPGGGDLGHGQTFFGGEFDAAIKAREIDFVAIRGAGGVIEFGDVFGHGRAADAAREQA